MDYSYLNLGLWNPIIQTSIIAVILLVSNIIRRKVPIIRNSMVPTAVLAGFLILILKSCGLLKIDDEYYAVLTYHCIAIGFIALSLRTPEKQEKQKQKLIGFKSGCIIVSSYMIQGVFGLLISIGLAKTIFPKFFHAAGLLLPMGYGQGPGQANNVGLTYEALGFVGGRSFGLALAASGYLVACIVGVLYINYLQKKGRVTRSNESSVSGSITIDTFQGENEIPIAESIDRVSIQFALVLLVYGATYLLTYVITKNLSAMAPGVAATLNPLLWGFNFMIGSGLALLTKSVLKGLRKVKLMERQYQNNYLLNRISGLSFDIMIVAGVGSIDIENLKGLLLPFILMSIAGAVFTFIHLQFVCKRVYGDYFYEGFISMYGMMTGTISSGVLLLREIDPFFKTPAAVNLIIGSSYAIALAAPLLILVGIAPKSITAAIIVLLILAAYYVLLTALAIKKPKTKNN